MFPHTITVCNLVKDNDDTLYYTTVIEDTLFEYKSNAVVTNEGVSLANTILVVIPFDFISEKSFISGKKYSLLDASERGKYFTLREGDFIIKGSVEETTLSLSEITNNYEDFTKISSVDTFDYGLEHWNVGGV